MHTYSAQHSSENGAAMDRRVRRDNVSQAYVSAGLPPASVGLVRRELLQSGGHPAQRSAIGHGASAASTGACQPGKNPCAEHAEILLSAPVDRRHSGSPASGDTTAERMQRPPECLIVPYSQGPCRHWRNLQVPTTVASWWCCFC